MEFTFGITTGGLQEDNLNKIIDSIEVINIPKYEVIIVGNADIQRKNTTVIPFDENQRIGWITRKKNIITLSAQYENIVYLHDTVAIEPDFYTGFLEFENDFEVTMTKMINEDGTRYRDWLLLDTNINGVNIPYLERILPYGEDRLKKFMYISGTYWVAKKEFMLRNPLNENLTWGCGEDIEWSGRVRNKTDIKMNLHSTVKLLVWKDIYLKPIPDDLYQKICKTLK